MSTTPRSAGRPAADPDAPAEPESPGRYSLSTDGSTEMAAVRGDSTQMAAVRAETRSAPVRRMTPPLGMPAQRPAPPPAPDAHRPSPPSSRRATLSFGAVHAESAPRSASAVLAGARPPSVPPLNVKRNSSLRPPPPPKRDSRPPAALQDFDEGSIAHAFDALMSDGPAQAGTHEFDLTPVRELFAELAANHMRHVRDFMIDVKWGEATRDWIDVCVPAVASLERAAHRLDLGELAVGLRAFAAELEVARGTSERTLRGATKDRLLDSYGQLVAILPQAFALDRDKSQREAVIVQSLLLSIPDVRKVTIDKLHEAGLTSLQVLFGARAQEIAQVAGIPEPLAARIVERFQQYRRELQNASPQDARAAERERLAALTAALKEQHEGYEAAARGWSDQAKSKKRDLFRAREETWLAISLLLARFGEVERLHGIEKVPFAVRIAQLTDYLEEAREKYRLEG